MIGVIENQKVVLEKALKVLEFYFAVSVRTLLSFRFLGVFCLLIEVNCSKLSLYISFFIFIN